METCIIIPARMSSSRFPGKILAPIHGKPMIQHVFEKCISAQVNQVVIATDHPTIKAACTAFGAQVMLTKSVHKSGTERCIEVAKKVNAELFINVQGDEPLIDPLAINSLIDKHIEYKASISTLVNERPLDENIQDPNTVKCVINQNNQALYFSRSAIPFQRGEQSSPYYLAHIGIYAFLKETLLEIEHLPLSRLEQSERLEQLRWLDNGIPIHVFKSDYQSVGVDVPADIAMVEGLLSDNGQ